MADLFWLEAVNAPLYILNQSYTKTIKKKTPQEAMPNAKWKEAMVSEFMNFLKHVEDGRETNEEEGDRHYVGVESKI